MRFLKKIARLLLLVFAAGLLIWFNQSYVNISPEMIKGWILSLGAVGPVVYILLYTVRPLTLFPASILSLAGGLAFGPISGMIYIMAGASGGAAVAFFLSRTFGRRMVPDSEWIGSLKRIIEKNGFLYVLVLRILPIVNFDLISYAAGLTTIRWGSFLLATIIGIIPGTFAYSFLGSSFTSDNKMIIYIAIGIFIILAIIPILFRKKMKKWLFSNQENEVKKDA
ncbi:TVP38/TMEM64 family protein [Metabacillus sp. KIGAM252]|uniref:TVP38/TMEM64 family membrane protein n=1 Tax=Metabacillus flavus TaxID=2823519 RepID=A0ABS5LHQ6_9BACI|nr:TVP38/TMEM64 family protein [Metabacillus flavus]